MTRDPYHALASFTAPFEADPRCSGTVVDANGKALSLALPVFGSRSLQQDVAAILAVALNEHLERRALEMREAA